MKLHLLRFLALISAHWAIAGTAATFTVLCDNSDEVARKGCTVKLTGPIVRGDAQKLRSTIKRPLPEGWHFHSLLLDSPGGDVRAAIELAAVVRQSVLDTTTTRLPKDQPKNLDLWEKWRWTCVSACFLVWVAGADRSTLPSLPEGKSGIGLHRPYLEKSAYANPPETVAAMQQQAMQATAEYLQREQVPRTLIEKMLQRASTQVHWLTEEEYAELSALSSWFEEMMIARCGYDPTYVREMDLWTFNAIDSHVRRRSGKPLALGPKHDKYIDWRQTYNACEYAIRKAAQAGSRE